MGARAKQMNLFASDEPAASPAADASFVRQELERVLWLARTAERLPWSPAKTASWEQLYRDLALSLPGEEGMDLLAAFEGELKRLRAA